MKILALEPYYGGSHRAFLDGWSAHSRHEWTVIGLPARKWKWRMRHAAITMAQDVCGRVASGDGWDVLICSDMLNLAEFLGLVPEPVRGLPSVAYFHENQLTYPVRHASERDCHFAFTNLTTALAASAVWFNSEYHRESFTRALADFLARMPDHQPLDAVGRIRCKSAVHAPGIEASAPRGARRPGPLRILWAARWEHDKNPEAFFEAVALLASQGVDFRLSVIGEQFSDVPPVFAAARDRHAGRIDRWGYQASRSEYEAALSEADVIVSTADHEFFGLSVVEALDAGAYPWVPNRLAYPEILGAAKAPGASGFLYEGGADALAEGLAELAGRLAAGDLWQGDPVRGRRLASRFHWSRVAPKLDGAIEEAPGSDGIP